MHTMYLRTAIALAASASSYTMPTVLIDNQPLAFPTPGRRQVIARKKRQGKRK